MDGAQAIRYGQSVQSMSAGKGTKPRGDSMSRPTPNRLRLASVLIALLTAGGCLNVHIDAVGVPGDDGVTITRVAIAPFVNRTDEPSAAKALGDLLASSLEMEAGLVVVPIPPDLKIESNSLDRTRAQEIATKLKVDGLITGTVFAYQYRQAKSGAVRQQTPVVRMDVRLIAAATGTIVWAASVNGERPLRFTKSGIPLTELAQETTRALAAELADRL